MAEARLLLLLLLPLLLGAGSKVTLIPTVKPNHKRESLEYLVINWGIVLKFLKIRMWL